MGTGMSQCGMSQCGMSQCAMSQCGMLCDLSVSGRKSTVLSNCSTHKNEAGPTASDGSTIRTTPSLVDRARRSWPSAACEVPQSKQCAKQRDQFAKLPPRDQIASSLHLAEAQTLDPRPLRWELGSLTLSCSSPARWQRHR